MWKLNLELHLQRLDIYNAQWLYLVIKWKTRYMLLRKSSYSVSLYMPLTINAFFHLTTIKKKKYSSEEKHLPVSWEEHNKLEAQIRGTYFWTLIGLKWTNGKRSSLQRRWCHNTQTKPDNKGWKEILSCFIFNKIQSPPGISSLKYFGRSTKHKRNQKFSVHMKYYNWLKLFKILMFRSNRNYFFQSFFVNIILQNGSQ